MTQSSSLGRGPDYHHVIHFCQEASDEICIKVAKGTSCFSWSGEVYVLAKFNLCFVHSCPLVFTPALTKEKFPYIMLIAHKTSLSAGQYEAVETGD